MAVESYLTPAQPHAIAASRKPHVCMVAYSDYVFDARIRREAETLTAHGFRVTCLKLRSGAAPERRTLNGVDVRELNVPKYQGKSRAAYLASYARFTARAAAACAGLLLKDDLHAVHVHNLPDFLVAAAFLPRLAGRKVVLDIHDSIPETFSTKFSDASLLWRLLCLEEQWSARVAHRVICVNHPQRDAIVGRGLAERKTLVSMNVPDPALFRRRPVVERPVAADGRFDLVYHGTMAERLGVDLAIQALARVRGRIPNVRLHLWGRGDDLPMFQRLAKEIGVEDAIDFQPKGYPLGELPERLAPMHLGVVGNRRTAAGELMLPVKLMEYVALGIPVVAPRLRTIQHYFGDAMVGYFEPEDVASLADAICRLHDDQTARYRQAAAAARFLDEYGWDRQGEQLVAFYRELLEIEQ